MSHDNQEMVSAIDAALHKRDAMILRESIREFPGPVAVYDENDLLIACNDLYRWVHGPAFDRVERAAGAGNIAYSDLIRESIRDAFPPEELDAHIADRIRAQREADGTPTDRYYRERGWFRIVKVRTPSGAVAGFATDITELKETTFALEQARAAAEEANLAKSAFLANMSHELRTPLNAIIGLSDALETGVFGEIENARHRRYLADIRDSGLHLLALISDILDLSKIEAGALDLRCEIFDLAPMIDECLTIILPIAGRNDVEVRMVGTVPDAAIFADRRKIKQALINILSNAVKYSSAGKTVEIAATYDEAGLRLSVRDEGIGIADDQLAFVFQPFGRLEDPTTSAEGTGLGLPIAQRFVEMHGGTILLKSRPGAGTEVTIVLPPDVLDARCDRSSADRD